MTTLKHLENSSIYASVAFDKFQLREKTRICVRTEVSEHGIYQQTASELGNSLIHLTS